MAHFTFICQVLLFLFNSLLSYSPRPLSLRTIKSHSFCCVLACVSLFSPGNTVVLPDSVTWPYTLSSFPTLCPFAVLPAAVFPGLSVFSWPSLQTPGVPATPYCTRLQLLTPQAQHLWTILRTWDFRRGQGLGCGFEVRNTVIIEGWALGKDCLWCVVVCTCSYLSLSLLFAFSQAFAFS